MQLMDNDHDPESIMRQVLIGRTVFLSHHLTAKLVRKMLKVKV
jgi:hypothetical protein